MNRVQALLNRIFDVSAYKTVGDRDRVRLAYFLIILEMFIIPIPLAISLAMRFSDAPPTTGVISTELLFGIIAATVAASIGGIHGLRRGWKPALIVPIAILWLLIVPLNVISGFTSDISTLLVLIPYSGLLLRQRGILVSTALSVALMVGYWLFGAQIFANYRVYGLVDQLRILFMLFSAALVSYLFLRLARSGEVGAQIASAETRFRLAAITTEISNRITRQMPLNDVLNSAVSLITESYPSVYHAQVFLIDTSSHTARLVASTGEAGKQLLARQHSLPVGSQSVIGQVTALGQPVVTRAGEAVHRPNQLLPQTDAEAAFPLRLGDTIIGALDLQSMQADAFETEELPIFQALADTLAVVIDNARLYEQTQQRLQENRRLLDETRRSAREVERLNLELTRQAWAETIEPNIDHYNIEIDFVNDTVQYDTPPTPTLVQALQMNELVDQSITIHPDQPDQGRVIAVPIRVRGLVVGAMEFEVDASGMLKPEDISLVQAMGERLGLEMDNARLYQKTRHLARRESVLNSVSARLQASNHVDKLLAEAARSLKTTLGAQRVAIRLGAPSNTQKRNGA